MPASSTLTAVSVPPLSDEQIEAFHRDGYLHVPRITDDAELDWLLGVYDNLFEGEEAWRRGDLFDFAGTDSKSAPASLPQILNPTRYQPALAEMKLRANAQAMAKQLLGSKAEQVFEHAIMKPARTGGETAWHQDEAFYSAYTNYRAITCWVSLQPVDEANGCLEFIPGSHLTGVVPHRSVNNDPRIHGLEAYGFDAGKAVACPLQLGGATFHHCRTLHHAGPNRTGGSRRAYALGYGVRSRELTIREEFPWNREKQTARMARERAAQGQVGRLVAKLKPLAKAVLR